ncbi:transport and Golgi organization protein 1 homolog isoform X1 [Ictidomys tridecemlineatus]
MMTAPAPAVAVQIPTSKTLLLQSLKIMKKEPSATQWKKSTKLSSKTTAKLSTSAKRIQKELAEITLNPLLTAGYSYERVDGSVRGEERHLAIKNFGQQPIFVFLLSTRAGGVGMNLKAADTVIFSDSDFNPQNDLRAAARAHRIGQNKAVKVIQPIGRDTVEKIVYRKAASKLQLTNTIIERDHFTLGAQKLLADPDLQVGRMFGYFPKDFIKVVREYTKEELQIPTDETDFVCFDVGGDDFDNYNIEELLGFLELYDSANEDSEKAIEKVGQFPEVSQDVEPEPKPVVANSQQIESAFSENTVDLEEQFLAQKYHPHADSQTDNAQGEQRSFELFEEILPDKLKVPESEKNKTSNISQVSNEQEKTDAYKLLKKEINPYLETKENKQEMSIIWKILKKTETTAKRVDISQVSNKQKTDAYKLLKKEINPYLETKENKQEMSIIWKILKKTETTAKRVDMMDKERGDMEMGKEESPLADEEAQGLFDRSDEENTQTSGISEVFQDKDSDDLEKDNPKEHLNTLESTEKATGKETSKEDLEDIGHITDAKSQGPASADLEDDIFPQSPHIALKPELSDQEEDLPIIRSFFIEQKSLQRFLKYIDVQELEAMLQEMSLKLNLAQQESLPYNLMPYYLEKVLDKVFRASESHILSVAEQMLDNRVNDNTDTGIKESNIFEEAAVLDDIQDLIYFVRYKHSTVEETAPLITAPPLEEIWAKAEELLITEGTPVDAADTENQLEIKVEEPADATLLDNILFLLYSFLLYLSKMDSHWEQDQVHGKESVMGLEGLEHLDLEERAISPVQLDTFIKMGNLKKLAAIIYQKAPRHHHPERHLGFP